MNNLNSTEPPPPHSPHRNDNKTKMNTSITGGGDSDLSPSRGAHIKKKQNTQGTPTQQQQQQQQQQHNINQQQRLLMLLCHAVKCPYTENKCPLSSQCWLLSAPEKEDEEYWETLDFEELGRNLTMKLNDEHISTILKYTDAKNKLKSIKMTGCTSILGHGLAPIRTSTVIKRMDLVLVKPTASMSCSKVPVYRK